MTPEQLDEIQVGDILDYSDWQGQRSLSYWIVLDRYRRDEDMFDRYLVQCIWCNTELDWVGVNWSFDKEYELVQYLSKYDL